MQLTLKTNGQILSKASVDGSTVKIYENLHRLPEKFTGLFAENSARSFFLSFAWFQNFCSTALDPGDEVRIFAIELGNEDQTPVAALMTRYNTLKRQFRTRIVSSLSNFYTSLYEPLYSSSLYSDYCFKKLAQSIATARPAWDAVNLKWLNPEDPTFFNLQQAFESAGMIVQTYFCAGNWYLPVNGMSYQQYFGSLRSSVRNIAKSKNKKIECTGRARVQILTGLEGLETGITAYERIYESSWKAPEPHPLFIPGLIRTCAREGWLRLGLVYVDEEPAAAQIWIVANRRASIYKMAYDPRFAKLSVGSFLTTRMMQHALDVDKVDEVDYLTGDDPYKKDWMPLRRERWGILAMNPHTIGGAVTIARHVGGRVLKRAMRSLRPLLHSQQST